MKLVASYHDKPEENSKSELRPLGEFWIECSDPGDWATNVGLRCV